LKKNLPPNWAKPRVPQKAERKNCLPAEALAPVEENPVRPGRIFVERIFWLGWLL
jgi:hypothetical protein